MIRSVYDVASVIAKYRLSVTNIELRDATRKSGETERKRGRGVGTYQAEIYVTAHARMTECVSVCVHPDVRVWSIVVLGTCSWAVTPYARTREEGVSGVPPLKKKSLAGHGGTGGRSRETAGILR